MKNFEVEDYFGLPGQLNVTTRVLIRRKDESQNQKNRVRETEERIQMMASPLKPPGAQPSRSVVDS